MSSYNMDTLAVRSNRLAFYFPDSAMRKIFTAGVSEKSLDDFTNADVHNGLEEGALSANVLRYITGEQNSNASAVLDAFIERIKIIQSEKVIFAHSDYDVDAGGVNSRGEAYPGFAGRVADRLVTQAKQEPFQSKLTPELLKKIEDCYDFFKSDIDSRRARHDRDTAQFNELFAGLRYAEVKKQLLHPTAGHLSPKHVGLFLFEAPEDKRLEFIQLFFEAVLQAPSNPMSSHLVGWFEKNMKKYIKIYNHAMPEDVKRISETFLTQSKQAT